MATPIIRFAGQTFEPLPSGALYWPAERALLVADLHLEKMSSFAKRGPFLPPYDTALTLKRLAADLAQTGAETRHLAGRQLSSRRGHDDAPRCRPPAARWRSSDQAQWIWLSGNHDPRPHALGGNCLPHLEHRGLTFTHHPRGAASSPATCIRRRAS